MVFKEFNKIARLNREIVITEKIDGTNAQIFIIDYDKYLDGILTDDSYIISKSNNLIMFAGSRKRWLKIGEDNYGFANWVQRNGKELFKLGEGRHFGEWYGQGIQRNYGLTEKRFALFNVEKWKENKPSCCELVPILYKGNFDTNEIKNTLNNLKEHGSYVSPFMNPEGIVIFHTASNSLFKVTIENDEKPKSLVKNVE